MWAAIRYRKGQALGLALLSALVTACAVFAPLYEGYLEQALLREGLVRYPQIDTALTIDALAVAGTAPDPAAVRQLFPPSLVSAYDSGQESWTGQVNHTGVLGPSVVTVRAAQDTCRGLRVVSGVCPTRAWQLLVSADDLRVQRWHLGDHPASVETRPPGTTPRSFPEPWTIVGTYEQVDDPGHWLGAELTGKAGIVRPLPNDDALMDDWVTPEATFASGWSASRLRVAYLLDDAVTLEQLPRIVPAVAAAATTATQRVPGARISTRIDDLVDGVAEGQRQARVIVPLVMGQIGLLAVVVLGLVAASAVEQRRPELALVRLRGRSGPAAARVLLLELGTIVALGAPVGYAVAVGLGEVARRVWLLPGVRFALPPTTVVAALLAVVVAVVCVAVVARPTVREPISTLLRRVPPRRRGWAIGISDAVVVAVAVAGVASVVSGNVSGPLVLAAPTLLALAVGLVLAQALVPLAAAVGRRASRTGRVVVSLTALQVARRPAVRRVVTVITVATALTVFATDAVVVGQRNRSERARVETGAELTLRTDAARVSDLVAAVAAADPSGTRATPVVTVQQSDPSALATLAVVPDQFATVAQFPRQRAAFDFGAISRGLPREAVLTGQRVSVTLSDIDIRDVPDPNVPPPAVPPSATALEVDVYLVPAGGGAPYPVDLGTFPFSERGPVTRSASVSCAGGCRLTGFGLVAGLGAGLSLSGTVTVGAVTADGGAPTDLGQATAWVGAGRPDAPANQRQDFATPVARPDPTAIGLRFFTQGTAARIDTVASAGALPALVLGGLPPGAAGDAFTAAGLDGLSTAMTRVDSIPYAPGGGQDEAVVNLSDLRVRTEDLSGSARAEVWVTDDATADRVREALRTKGIGVTSESRRADAEALFDNSASAWGLEMALVMGLVALLLAALVLVLVTAASARARSRDVAALRLAGVSVRQLRTATHLEQVVVVLVSVVAGVGCGLVGAHLAVPLTPFFTEPSRVFPVDLRFATAPVAAAVVAGLLVLLAVAGAVAGRLVRAASFERVREP